MSTRLDYLQLEQSSYGSNVRDNSTNQDSTQHIKYMVFFPILNYYNTRKI